MEVLHQFFSNLYQFNELIRWGGYTVMFMIVFAETGLLAGFFLPGDSLLVTAGVLAAVDGVLNIWVLNGILISAAILGDTTGYWLGYYLGPKLFNKTDSIFFHRDHITRTQKFYEKHGPKTIVIARFVPMVRTFAPTVAGVGRMRYGKFLIYNIVGGMGWVASMTLLGFFLGHSIPNLEKKIHWVILAVIFLSFLPLAKEWLDHRKSSKLPGS